MQLGAGKHDDTADRTNGTNLRLHVDSFCWPRQWTGILLEKLRRAWSMHFVPFVIIVPARIILDGMVPIIRMKSHAVIVFYSVDWHPPVDLTLRRGVRRVAARVPCTGDPCGEICITRRCPPPGQAKSVGVTSTSGS